MLRSSRTALPVGGRRLELRADGADGGFAILRLPGREQIGEVRYRIEDGCLSFQQMEVAPGMRGRGYGSEAVRLVEERARGQGVTSFRADVDVRNGLGLYFWLRLGYRPASDAEAAWRRDGEQGTISMIRTAGQAPRIG